MELLKNLIAQAMFQLIEPEIKIKCREKDVTLVKVNYQKSFKYRYNCLNCLVLFKHAVEGAKDLYKKKLNRDVKVIVLEQYLNPQM